MSAEQLVVLALLVAAFAAGWFARGGRAGGQADEVEGGGFAPLSPPVPSVPPPGAVGLPAGDARPRALAASASEPARDADRALALAAGAYETAVDRWLDERDAISPAGRAAVAELERAVQRLDHAAARLDEVDETLGDAAYDAVDALRDAVKHLAAFRDGRAIDADTSRELDRIEDEVERARAAFAGARA